jgi:ArsR family transcriptional regulator
MKAYVRSMLDIEIAAKRLAELGNASRLKAFRLLVQAGCEGLPVGDIQAHLGIPQSTLSHHIAHLVAAGLITQTREGRVLRCRVDFDAIRDVLSFLLEDCCSGIVSDGKKNQCS